MSIVLQSTGGGQITIQEPATASNFTQSLPAATGTVMVSQQALTIPNVAGTVMVSGNQPAFRAFAGAAQTLTSTTDTRIALTGKTFDTASCFNNTASTVGGIPPYAFLPNVAGYYQINAVIGVVSTTTLNYNFIQIRKNNLNENIAIYGPYNATTNYGSLAVLLFLNGTTDYVDLFVQAGGNPTLSTIITNTFLSGSLVRAA
jgi:hypothetical protein